MDHKKDLTAIEAVIVWLLRGLNYHQHEIAAVFRVNQRCVHEVLSGKKHTSAKRIAASLRV
jgi:hypothetical protein